MEKKRLAKWLVGFLAIMAGFTALSRAAASVGVAQVQIQSMQNQLMVHKVQGTGKIEGTREYGVFALENQRVEGVRVQPGQSVEKGQVLMKLSMESLKETIAEKEKEIAELTGMAEDAKSSAGAEEAARHQAESAARENLNAAVNQGDVNIANARYAADVARDRLREYDNGHQETFTDGSQTLENATARQMLEDDLRAKEEALAQAIMSRDQEIRTARQGLEAAALQKGTDSTLDNARRNLEFAREELEELLLLREQKGKIKSPVNGTVKEILSPTGSLTSGGAVLTIYEKKGSLRMTGAIGKDDLKYAEIGGRIALLGGGKKEAAEGVIIAIAEDETDQDKSILTVEVPEAAFAIGQNVEYTIEQKTGPYNTCIPLTALYEENGQAYVYVAESRDTVLGEQLVARKVLVVVQDKNESIAVLQNGALSGNQKIIVQTNREMTEGSPVRLQEL